jgi:two-component system chemotaxis response regulator CheB
MWEIGESPLRYRCHTGHAFSAGTLASGQRETAEAMLWSAVRSLHERAHLLRRMAAAGRATGDTAQADVMESRAAAALSKAGAVVGLLEGEQGKTGAGASA